MPTASAPKSRRGSPRGSNWHAIAATVTANLKISFFTKLFLCVAGMPLVPIHAAADDGKLRISVFGAHPDDAQDRAGGTAAKWAKLGHHVKLVSVTNGDIGHWQSAGGPLAQPRLAEVKKRMRSSVRSRRCWTSLTGNSSLLWRAGRRSSALFASGARTSSSGIARGTTTRIIVRSACSSRMLLLW